MKKLFVFSSLMVLSLLIMPVKAQQLPPPRNLQVNPLTLEASWEAPRSILLEQDFESPVFPPAGWSSTSMGVGWQRANYGGSPYFFIPAHSYYAVANDDAPGQSNNGCCDYLVTPSLNLTALPGYHLGFQSLYTGGYGEMAYVEMSIDGGTLWTPIYIVTSDDSWKQVDIDLSAWSGINGLSSVKFAFHADDAGLWGTGWAVDDVLVYTDSIGPSAYQCALDDSVFLATLDTYCQIPAGMLQYGDTASLKVAAVYEQVVSPYDSVDFISAYLIPPSGLQASSDSNLVHLIWNAPFDSLAGTVPVNLVSFNIYRNDSILFSCGSQTTDIELSSYIGLQRYTVSAVYDLGPCGFPGTFGESIAAGPDTLYHAYGYTLPFTENWDSKNFNTGNWTAQPGWSIDNQEGNPPPSARFDAPAGIAAYDRFLESYWINSTTITTTTPYHIFLEYDLKKEDIITSTNECLYIEIWNGTKWKLVDSIINNGNLNFKHKKNDITFNAVHRAFRIRFRATGTLSNFQEFWNIDSIRVYSQLALYPPTGLDASLTGWPEKDDVILTWEFPQGNGLVQDFILDDNSMENGWAINPGYESWLGNEFSVNKTGVLKSIELYWQSNASAGTEPLSIDIFDANRNLTFSSSPFVPEVDSWQTIDLPDVPFTDGFYAMVHWNMLSGQTNYLGSDENGPNAAANYGWYLDGIAWSHLSDFGYAPCVFLLRAHALVYGDQPEIIYGPASTGPGTPGSSCQLTRSNRSNPTISPPEPEPVEYPAYSPSALLGFNIYHQRSIDPYPGQPDSLTPWLLIGSVSAQTNQFIEYNIFRVDDYYYHVTAIYDEGESVPSNKEKIPKWDKLDETTSAGIKIIPNPADKWIRLEPDKKFSLGKVFNITGMEMERFELTGRQFIILDTSHYSPGTYIVRFMGDDGTTVSQKIMVQH